MTPSQAPIVVGGATVIALSLAAVLIPGDGIYPRTGKVNIAFIGNSMQYYNDFPRFFESLTLGHVHQNSCLRGAASINTILRRGNGMLDKFDTENALRPDGTYDFGACTVSQLLFGYDPNLESVAEDSYYVDGVLYKTNPCQKATGYVQPEESDVTVPEWDYIVMNDHTIAPALNGRRKRTFARLEEFYIPWFLEVDATPVFIHTHAFSDSVDRNMSMFSDLADFTNQVYYGYRMYADLVSQSMPKDRQPLIAPVGVAFLTVWEEDPDMWYRLYNTDDMHASPHGTYLQGCVVHATIFGQMPYREAALPTNLSGLWSRARIMARRTEPIMPLPTLGEAEFLFGVAERVVLGGYRPKGFMDFYAWEREDIDEAAGSA